ncbi:MAG TPA: ATP-binding cassette domain-containing protein [Vicinamibacterales bacterium]|nr:ATP-binding cassette domain-containing protein [Vicinamibacterales bacterium]
MDRDRAPILEVRGLRRSYGRLTRVEAVRGVSFAVAKGEIFGLIGPDGAGKTSIIQMIAGVLTPHAGSAAVEGLDVAAASERIKRRIGYMPQGLGSNLYDSLTVLENIEFFRDLRGLPPDVYRRNRDDLLAVTRLAPFLDRPAAKLSGGMRQKLALICTLIHLPDVLLLDEPTTGVDPISRQEFWHIIQRVVDERQTTVLLATSYMDEAERCQRIALLHEGAIIGEGTPAGIKERAKGCFAHLIADPQRTALQVLRQRPDVDSTEVFGDAIHIRFNGELRAIESALTAAGVAIRGLSLEEAGLEDVFLQLLTAGQQKSPVLRFGSSPARAPGATVECRGVSRRFGAFVAVDAVDLSVRTGEIFGLLGPNGAGKTTLIKMMCGLLEPTAGAIVAGGLDLRTARARLWTAMGYMSQRFSLYQDLTVAQNLQLYADLYGLENAASLELVDWLGLDPYLSRLTRDLPTGVRQRISLLCAVLHHPSIVFLDEPTSGVDPQARRVFWDLIYSLSRDAGITVLVSTHYMDEAAHCDRLGLMHQGRLIADGSPDRLKRISEERSGSLLAVRAADVARALAAVRRQWPGAVRYGDHIRLRSRNPDADQLAVMALLEEAGLGRARVEPVAMSMDETFIDFIASAEARRA